MLQVRHLLSVLGFIKLANASAKVNSLFAERNVRLIPGLLSVLRAISRLLSAWELELRNRSQRRAEAQLWAGNGQAEEVPDA